MEKFFNSPIDGPKVPIIPAPVLDEQIENVKRFDLHDPEFWEDLNKMEDEYPAKYNEIMALVAAQLEDDQKNNFQNGWEEQKEEVKNNKVRVSREDKKKKKEEERLKAIERYKNSLDELYKKDGTEKYTDI